MSGVETDRERAQQPTTGQPGPPRDRGKKRILAALAQHEQHRLEMRQQAAADAILRDWVNDPNVIGLRHRPDPSWPSVALRAAKVALAAADAALVAADAFAEQLDASR